MSLFKYTSAENAKKILAGKIRFTQPSAFNDPFELLPEIHDSKPCDSHEKLSIKFSLTEQRRNPIPGLLPDDFVSDKCNDILSRRIVEDLNQTIGILCLSKKCDSLLMLSHYAEQYAGCVIEFKKDHKFFQGLVEVEYKNIRPKYDVSTFISDQPVPIAELCAKSEQWQYEEEVRLLRCLVDCEPPIDRKPFPVYLMAIPQDCIKRVILGERTSIPDQREIWNLVKDTNIELAMYAVANWEYAFRLEKIKLGQPCSEMNPFISPRTAHIFSEMDGYIGDSARWMLAKHQLSSFVNMKV